MGILIDCWSGVLENLERIVGCGVMAGKKKVNLNLVELDGNAFMLMGAFSRQAKKEGWTREEIDAVRVECKSADYDHLIRTLMDNCDY